MSTNEVKEENVKTIVKLGIDVKDIADIYLKVATKGHDISKQKFNKNRLELYNLYKNGTYYSYNIYRFEKRKRGRKWQNIQ